MLDISGYRLVAIITENLFMSFEINSSQAIVICEYFLERVRYVNICLEAFENAEILLRFANGFDPRLGAGKTNRSR